MNSAGRRVQAEDTENERFVMIQVRPSSRDALQRILPRNQKQKYFASDLIDNAIAHYERAKEQLSVPA